MQKGKIKVLHVIKSLGRGGAEMLLPETLKLHNSELFEFHYIYFLPWKDQMVSAITSSGGRVRCFRASNNIQILFQVTAIKAYVAKERIELVHCHLPWAGFVGRLLHRSTGIPVIYTEHNKQERYHRLTFWINRFTFSWQTLAMGVSEDVVLSIQRNIHCKIPVITVLNGVNTDFFKRQAEKGVEIRRSLEIPENALVVGTVAVFRFQKRLIEWLKVLRAALDSGLEIYGIIVGDGPLKPEILEQVSSLNLSSRVSFAGLQEDVKPWLSAMDIYMMSSVFEGLPIALLEAMSMECAIASTDAGGISELIRNDVDGLLVGVDQWPTLVDCLKKYSSAGYRVTMAARARARVVESFSMRRMVDRLEQVYQDVAKQENSK